jgi:hypothetical protein
MKGSQKLERSINYWTRAVKSWTRRRITRATKLRTWRVAGFGEAQCRLHDERIHPSGPTWLPQAIARRGDQGCPKGAAIAARSVLDGPGHDARLSARRAGRVTSPASPTRLWHFSSRLRDFGVGLLQAVAIILGSSFLAGANQCFGHVLIVRCTNRLVAPTSGRIALRCRLRVEEPSCRAELSFGAYPVLWRHPYTVCHRTCRP